MRKGTSLVPFLFIFLCLALYLTGGVCLGAEKKAKKTPPAKETVRESAINDGNVVDLLKKSEEQLKKGVADSALVTLTKIHDYAGDVLKTVKYFQTQYEKVVADSSVSQSDREDILIKLKRMEQLVPKYTQIKQVSAYDLGYGYAKKGDSEKGRKYLLEVLETAPFSTKQDSLWMRSKKLLLGLYSLEGEF